MGGGRSEEGLALLCLKPDYDDFVARLGVARESIPHASYITRNGLRSTIKLVSARVEERPRRPGGSVLYSGSHRRTRTGDPRAGRRRACWCKPWYVGCRLVGIRLAAFRAM
jgi:hypothetical protein